MFLVGPGSLLHLLLEPSTKRIGRKSLFGLRPVKQFRDMQEIGQGPFASRVLDQALAHLLIDKHITQKADETGLFPLAAVEEEFLEPGLPLRFGRIQGGYFRRVETDQTGGESGSQENITPR